MLRAPRALDLLTQEDLTDLPSISAARFVDMGALDLQHQQLAILPGLLAILRRLVTVATSSLSILSGARPGVILCCHLLGGPIRPGHKISTSSCLVTLQSRPVAARCPLVTLGSIPVTNRRAPHASHRPSASTFQATDRPTLKNAGSIWSFLSAGRAVSRRDFTPMFPNQSTSRTETAQAEGGFSSRF
jgi:hypothetical protein